MLRRLHFTYIISSLLFGLACLPLNSFGQSESTIFVITEIRFEGNKVTQEAIMLRELSFELGDTLTLIQLEEKCRESSRLLSNTRLFNFVDVIPELLEGGKATIKISVVERWYWWPQFIFEFADPNFNTWWETRDANRLNVGMEVYRQNFRGRNEDLRFRAKFGYTDEFAFSYRLPYLGSDQKLGMQFAFSFKEQDEITIATVDNKREFYRDPGNPGRTEQFYSLEFTYRPGLYVRHSVAFTLADVEVDDSLAILHPAYLNNGKIGLSYLKLGYQFNLDKRDNRAYPLDGYLFQIELSQRGLGIVNNDGLGVFESSVSVRSYRPLSERWFIGGGLRFKVIPTKRLPYYIQEGLGYSSYVRGYEYYVIDGQQFALWRSNLKFALIPRKEIDLGFGPKTFTRLHFASYLNVFMDAGRVWDRLYASESDLSDEWMIGLGAGLDLVSYYDSVIRLEYSVNGQGRTGFYLHFVQPI